jgi:hypothetical protein
MGQITKEAKDRLEVIERYIILFLGVKNKPIPSFLHIEKELFIFSNFNPIAKKFIVFTPSYYGPSFDELKEILEYPFYYPSAWEITKKGKKEEIRLTPKGKEIFKKICDLFKNDKKFISNLKALRTIRDLYDSLSKEELLLLVYTTFPEFTEKSKIMEEIYNRREEIAQRLLKKGVITEEKCKEIFKVV